MLSKKPFVFIFLLVVIFAGFFIFRENIREFVSLEHLRELKIQWHSYYENNVIKVSFLYFLLNVTVATLPTPGVSMISCMGGALLGFWPAFLLSGLASSLGNLITFLFARYSMRDWIYQKFYSKYAYYFNKLEENATELLFSMRLIPLIPSFVTTLILSISLIRPFTFYWISCIGRVPMVALYAWTGYEISKIEKLEDILDIRFVLLLLILSILPWVMKFLKKHINQKH